MRRSSAMEPACFRGGLGPVGRALLLLLRCAAGMVCVLLVTPGMLSGQVAAPDFSIILLPDTQNEAQYYPQELYDEITWIVNNRSAYNIQAVLGLGDIVNDGENYSQQGNADRAIRQLDDAGIPYFMALGNHDYDKQNTANRSAIGYNDWWGAWRYAGKSYYRDHYSGGNENFYGVLTINGRGYVLLVLEFNARDAVLDWAASIVGQNADKEVIVVTHSFLYLDGFRADHCDRVEFGDSDDLPDDNYGSGVWNKFISQYPNIILVVNGHFTVGPNAAARRADLGVNGNLVNQMMSNYQDNNNGGNGWFRILTFRPGSNRIHVTTYSPTIPDTMTDSANNFDVYYHNPGFTTGRGTINGRVRSDRCSVIAGATVSAGNASTTTDAKGRFSLAVPAPAKYTVTAQASGYQQGSLSLQVNDSYSAQAKFLLGSGGLGCAAPATAGVNICSPANGSSVSSTFTITAAGKNTNGTSGMDVWLDGKKFGWYGGTTFVNATASAAAGSHQLDIYAVGIDGELALQSSFFSVTGSGCATPSSPGVNICSPGAGSNNSASVHILASGRDSSTTAGMDVWIDGTKFGWYSNTTTVDAMANLASGTHLLDIYAVGASGELQRGSVTFSVAGSSCPVPTAPGVNICSPANNATLGSSVLISAAGRDSSSTAGMDVWLDGSKVGWYSGSLVNVQLNSISSGSHQLDIYAVGVDGELQRNTVFFTVA